MKNAKVKRTAVFILAAAVIAAAAGAFIFGRGPREQSLTAYAMGSYVTQKVYGGGDTAAAYTAVKELEALISWRLDGDIAKLNSGESVTPDNRTERVLAAALAVREKSGGAFDPAILPVSSLWDFDGEPRVPGDDELAEALKAVSGTAVNVSGGRYSLSGNARLDLGGVGKGAACDAIIESWKETGARAGVAAVGGSVGLYGEKPGGELWTVAVRDPAGDGALGELKLSSGCVSTSGSYEKTFQRDGVTYHHLLDPSTGYPADSGLVSVTVWRAAGDGSDGALTDALATACFVLGMEDGAALLKEFSAEGIFVTSDNRVYVSGGLEFSLSAGGYVREELP